MIIGVLHEPESENRVILTPENVSSLVKLKAQVIIEKNSGEKATFYDDQYIEAGASVVNGKEVIKKSDLLLRITPFEKNEIEFINEKQIIIGTLNPFFNIESVKALTRKKITSFSLELIPRITRAQSMDVLSSMATIAGYKAVLDAALHLNKFFPMFMSAAGTIKPARVLILGAGVAGLQAVAFARKLGAVVEVFDVRSAVKDEVKSLGGKFIEVTGYVEDKAANGYAVEQTEDFKKKQADIISIHAQMADVVICSAQILGKKAPILVKKETVEGMKPGTVIVDLAASTGGNCELTKNGQIISHKDVTIIGKTEYSSEMAHDASKMFGNNTLNFLKLFIDEEGNLNLDFDNEVIQKTCLTHDGEIKNERVKSVI